MAIRRIMISRRRCHTAVITLMLMPPMMLPFSDVTYGASGCRHYAFVDAAPICCLPCCSIQGVLLRHMLLFSIYAIFRRVIRFRLYFHCCRCRPCRYAYRDYLMPAYAIICCYATMPAICRRRFDAPLIACRYYATRCLAFVITLRYHADIDY